MVSGNTFEQIEEVLSQIGEKDKVVQQLMLSVNQIKGELANASGNTSSALTES